MAHTVLSADLMESAPNSANPRAFLDVLFREWEKTGRGAKAIDVLLRLLALGDSVKIGTACSGSECPIIQLQVFAQWEQERRGISKHSQLGFNHSFSCELDARKVKWIIAVSNPARIFKDIVELGRGRAYDWLSGQQRQVERVDILIHGTSCKDFSPQPNASRATKQHACSKGLGTSGQTYLGLSGGRCKSVVSHGWDNSTFVVQSIREPSTVWFEFGLGVLSFSTINFANTMGEPKDMFLGKLGSEFVH